MAAASAVPNHRIDSGLSEDSPLLGGPGDVSQPVGHSLFSNVWIGTPFTSSPLLSSLYPHFPTNTSPTLPGTGIIAQFGVIILTSLVWASVFLHPPLSLFSFHPLFNSSAILILTESILLLQPTHTAAQKLAGARAHFVLNNIALDLLIAAFVIIEYNKFAHAAYHFTSVHGVLGLITYITLLAQSSVGITMYFVPSLYGGEDRAKAIYKWHRLSGYTVLTMMLATVAAATQTETGMDFLKLRLWAVLLCAVLILAGVLPRIRKSKFGWGPKPSGAFGQ